ncbi:MAG: hypothetical protein ACK4TA_00265 [Saprospiraceae bacterium]
MYQREPFQANYVVPDMAKKQLVTFTLFRFSGWRNRWWAFRQMGLSAQLLRGVAGLQFGKMLGSGGGKGFSVLPNLGVYGLLGVWEDENAARQFFTHHSFFQANLQHTQEYWTIFLNAYMAHGQWDGQSPFQLHDPPDENAPIAVLTRATIHTRRLWHFWQHVPRVSHSIEAHPGKLFSIGVGELPIVQQVTFSLWENAAAMKNYAYQSRVHSNVVKQTRRYNWYKEELFARFVPIATEGTWGGSNPLANYTIITQ